MKTSWKEIRKLEDQLETGDPAQLVKFVLKLKEEGLLHRHIYSTLCSTVPCEISSNRMYEVLHEFAADYADNTNSIEER